MAAIDKTYIRNIEQYREIRDWCLAQAVQHDSLGDTFHPADFLPHKCEYDDDWNEISSEIYPEEDIQKWLDDVKKDVQKYKTEESYKESKEYLPDNIDTFEKYCEYVDTEYVEIPLWNTPHYFDVYLIRNCPVQFIQDRLKEQYGGGWSKEALLGRSNSYEAIKNGTSIYDAPKPQAAKIVKMVSKPNFNIKCKERWLISVQASQSDKGCIYYRYNSKHNCFVTDRELCEADSSDKFCVGTMSKRKLVRWIRNWNLPVGLTIYVRGDYVGQDYKFITK